MKENIKVNRSELNIYIKSKFKAFAETFAVLGDILGNSQSEEKITEAEMEVERIKKESNLDNIIKLEKRMELVKEGPKQEKKNEKKSGKNYSIEKVNEKSNTNIKNNNKEKIRDEELEK